MLIQQVAARILTENPNFEAGKVILHPGVMNLFGKLRVKWGPWIARLRVVLKTQTRVFPLDPEDPTSRSERHDDIYICAFSQGLTIAVAAGQQDMGGELPGVAFLQPGDTMQQKIYANKFTKGVILRFEIKPTNAPAVFYIHFREGGTTTQLEHRAAKVHVQPHVVPHLVPHVVPPLPDSAPSPCYSAEYGHGLTFQFEDGQGQLLSDHLIRVYYQRPDEVHHPDMYVKPLQLIGLLCGMMKIYLTEFEQPECIWLTGFYAPQFGHPFYMLHMQVEPMDNFVCCDDKLFKLSHGKVYCAVLKQFQDGELVYLVLDKWLETKKGNRRSKRLKQ